MKRKQYLLLVVLTIVSGLVGGAVSNWLLMPKMAVADEKQPIMSGDKVITANAFHLVNEENRIRAKLEMADGNARLSLLNEKGQTRLRLYGDGYTGMYLFSNERRAGIALGMSPGGSPIMGFYDKAGRLCMSFLSSSGSSSIHFHDEANRARMSLMTLSDGSSSIHFRDRGERDRIRLGTLSDGSPFISLLDESGGNRIQLLSSSDGSPSISLFDESGKPRTAIGCTGTKVIATGETRTRAESSILLFDKNEKVMWEAP